MSHRDFVAALARVNYNAGLLAAVGNQQAALADAEALAQRFEHYVALATPLPFSPQPSSEDYFSPFASPALGGGPLQPYATSACDGSFFAHYYAQQPPPLAPPTPKLEPKKVQSGDMQLRFTKAMGYDNPPPPPNKHDITRTDRPQLYVLPQGAPDVPDSMYPRRSAKKRAANGAKKPAAPDAG